MSLRFALSLCLSLLCLSALMIPVGCFSATESDGGQEDGTKPGGNTSDDHTPDQPKALEPGENFINWKREDRGELDAVRSFLQAAQDGDAEALASVMTDYAENEAAGLFGSLNDYAAACAEALGKLEIVQIDPGYPLARPFDADHLRAVIVKLDSNREAYQEVILYVDTTAPEGMMVDNVHTSNALSVKHCAPAFGTNVASSLRAFKIYFYAAIMGGHYDAPLSGGTCTTRERLTYLRNACTPEFRDRALALDISEDASGKASLLTYLDFTRHIFQNYYKRPIFQRADPHERIVCGFPPNEAGVGEGFQPVYREFHIDRQHGQSRIAKENETSAFAESPSEGVEPTR